MHDDAEDHGNRAVHFYIGDDNDEPWKENCEEVEIESLKVRDDVALFTSLRDGNRPHRMEGANISTEHSPGSAPPSPTWPSIDSMFRDRGLTWPNVSGNMKAMFGHVRGCFFIPVCNGQVPISQTLPLDSDF